MALPPISGLTPPRAQPLGDARAAAQRAFFEAALVRSAAPAATAPSAAAVKPPAPPATPIARTAPDPSARPGSVVNILV